MTKLDHHQSTTNTHRDVFNSLQAGRAIAALLVVFFHDGGLIFALPKYWGKDPLGHFFNFGHAGVEFFFVLSGFIIQYVHGRDSGCPARLLPYLKKRFLRIYPMYWLVLIPVLCIDALSPSLGKPFERDQMVMFSSILLVHFNTGLSVLTVAWTLYHEVLYYTVFSLVILCGNIGYCMLVLWIGASFLYLHHVPPPTGNEFLRSWIDFYFSPLHFLFAMGMIACWVVRTCRLTAPVYFAIVGIVIFLSVGMDENYFHWLPRYGSTLLYGVGSTIALIGFVELERRHCLRVPSLLVLIGNASYSIYLTHFPLLSILAKVSLAFGAKRLPSILFYFALPAIVTIVGVGTHLFVEKPTINWLSRRKWIARI